MFSGLQRLFRCRRLWSARARECRGATAVEMALIAPVFFYFLMGSIEMALAEAAQQLMENAAYNTSRLAKTGYVGSGQTQLQTISQLMVNELQSFGSLLDTTQVTMTEVAYNGFSSIGAGTGTNGPGNPDQIVVYTLTYPWKMLTPMLGQLVGTPDGQGNWILNLTARIVVRNEPY